MPARHAWQPRLYLPASALYCLLAAIPRLHTLADANPWWDEGFTYWLASQDVPGMLLRTAGDTHPPLSYFLYQLWMPLAGRAVYALRFQAVVFGVLAVPVCGAIARRLGGPLAGVLATLLIAISPFHIWWSQQISPREGPALHGSGPSAFTPRGQAGSSCRRRCIHAEAAIFLMRCP